MWDHRNINLPATASILRGPCLVRWGHLHFLLLGHRVVGFYYQTGISSGKSRGSLPGAQLRNLSEDSEHTSQPLDFSPGNLRDGLWGWTSVLQARLAAAGFHEQVPLGTKTHFEHLGFSPCFFCLLALSPLPIVFLHQWDIRRWWLSSFTSQGFHHWEGVDVSLFWP